MNKEQTKRLEENTPAADDILFDFDYSGKGNAERMLKLYREEILYCAKIKEWYVWDKIRWERDDTEKVESFADATIVKIMDREASIKDVVALKAYKAFIKRSRYKSMIAEMLFFSRLQRQVILEALDTHDRLLICKNGTLDLDTLELRISDPADLMTKCCGTEYDPDAVSPQWEQFIEEITEGDNSLADYLQRIIGYSLSGDTSEHAFYILYGNGFNGKGTFMNVVKELLKEYAQQGSVETIYMRRNDRPIRSDIAHMLGARLISFTEGDQGRHLDEGMVKTLTGEDAQNCRELYGKEFDYVPTAKFILQTNHMPEIRGTDEAIWGRIKLIPFKLHIKERDRNLTLGRKLLEELPGILNWALKGWEDWKANGMQTPQRIKDETLSYRHESDIFGKFLDDKYIKDPNGKVLSSSMKYTYVDWCLEEKEKQMSDRNLWQTLAFRGFTKTKMKGSAGRERCWRGLKEK
ncbi:MAG: phage/plasmid primase, P4 family [Omnitrophica bacterium]|nr:phage/plasmid primase, P4 family [Candidatus Omnitrophota bacterium]